MKNITHRQYTSAVKKLEALKNSWGPYVDQFDMREAEKFERIIWAYKFQESQKDKKVN